MRRWLGLVILVSLAGCNQPSGFEPFDKFFVREYDARLKLTALVQNAPSVCGGVCGSMFCNEQPEPTVRLGYFEELHANDKRIRLLAEKISTEGGWLFKGNYKSGFSKTAYLIPNAHALECTSPPDFGNDAEKDAYLVAEIKRQLESQRKWLKEVSQLYDQLAVREK